VRRNTHPEQGTSCILTLLGTRPEVIKLAPVVRELEARPGRFRTLNAASGQHTDLVHPFARQLGLRIDLDLQVGIERQNPTEVCHRALAALAPLLSSERPDAILVEGDTTTAFAGALAGFYHGIPVGHVEAGLRSGDRMSPFPEELNRRLITQLASFHFAPTERNVETLRSEGVPEDRIALTGNPVVDSVQWAREHTTPSPRASALLRDVAETRLVVLTTHRRESFGPVMEGRMRVLRRFVERHSDTTLVFPVHPNPEVRDSAARELGSAPRVFLVEPLEYLDFVHLLSKAWLIVSDSGGVQEEAPSLGRPVLVIRENTERPEALEAGTARLVGDSPEALGAMLEESYADLGWFERASLRGNPFGCGDSGRLIADALERFLDPLDRLE
jgi:UDP-N-acetylglucosamine 2-epimerase (non-hydrolysing)